MGTLGKGTDIKINNMKDNQGDTKAKHLKCMPKSPRFLCSGTK